MKFTVSLGMFHDEVKQEAETPMVAIKNVLATVSSRSVLAVPVEDKRETYWRVRDESGVEKLVVQNGNTARKLLGEVRKDVTEVFWFVTFDQDSHQQKGKKFF
jgi:hypothetical protein